MVIDLTPIYNFFSLPPDVMLYKLLLYYGWLPIAFVFVWGSIQVWLFWRNGIYKSTLNFVLLAIDIPKGNDLLPKSVENMFSYLGGAHSPPDLIEKWWLGMFQLSWSFEIVSIEGYTQFLVWTPTDLRDLLEAAIYSQYPDAEITEVNDYTEGIPTKYPNEEYNVWGGEFKLAKSNAYPIKTYREFEHTMGEPEKQFKDPMAVFMDTLSSMKKGEQFWYQIIVYPTGFDWPSKGDKEISKILKETPKGGDNIIDKLITGFVNLLWSFSEMIVQTGVESKETEKKDEALKMMNLKPKEKKQVEAIQNKISKQGFECKIRFVYVAKKEAWNKGKAIFGVIGYMKQFLDMDLNNLRIDMDMTATSAHYFFTDYQKNIKKSKIVSAYKDRTGTRGRARFILNTEELATLWHFPVEAVVRAPLIQKTPGKKGEPPMALPFSEEIRGNLNENKTSEKMIDVIFTDREIPPKKILTEEKKEDTAFKNIKEETMDDIFKDEEIENNKINNQGEKGKPPPNLPFA